MKLIELSGFVVMLAACGGAEAPSAPSAPSVRQATEDATVSFRYSALSADDPPRGNVDLLLTDSSGAQNRIALGTFTGGCAEQDYAPYRDLTPAPQGTFVLGTSCYYGGASLIVVTRLGDELLVSTADKGDGAEEDESGDPQAAALTPWRILSRTAFPAGRTLRVGPSSH